MGGKRRREREQKREREGGGVVTGSMMKWNGTHPC